jgi:hypothetical protein
MKRVMVGMVILCFSIAFAEISENPGDQPQDNPWFYYQYNTIPMDELYSSSPAQNDVPRGIDWAAISPSGFNVPDHDIKSNKNEHPDFGDDVLVMEHGLPTLGYLSTDQDELNGDIYISLLVPKSGIEDSVYTYKSTDGGNSWSQFALQVGGSSTGGIANHKVLCGNDASGGLVYSFCHYDGSGSSGGIWVARYRSDGSFQNWVQIVVAGDTINTFDVDRNIEDPEHYFLVTHAQTTDIRALTSSDYCNSWGNATYISGSGGEWPSVAAGGAAYVYFAYPYNDTTGIRVGRHTNNLGSGSWNFEDIDTDAEGDFTPSVAAARTTPGTSQVAWVLYRHNHNPNYDIHEARTTDGGGSWSGGGAWDPINFSHNTWSMRWPYARVSYNSSLLRAIATVPESPTDSLVYAFSRNTSPTTWEDRGVHNDNRITGEYGGKVEYSDDCAGGYIVYREFAAEQVWFDAWNFTGVAETRTKAINFVNLAPNPVSTVTRLSYTVSTHGLVEIVLYDASGRTVETLVNENQSVGTYTRTINSDKLSSGVYFIEVNTPEGNTTTSMTVVR